MNILIKVSGSLMQIFPNSMLIYIYIPKNILPRLIRFPLNKFDRCLSIILSKMLYNIYPILICLNNTIILVVMDRWYIVHLAVRRCNRIFRLEFHWTLQALN